MTMIRKFGVGKSFKEALLKSPSSEGIVGTHSRTVPRVTNASTSSAALHFLSSLYLPDFEFCTHKMQRILKQSLHGRDRH